MENNVRVDWENSQDRTHPLASANNPVVDTPTLNNPRAPPGHQQIL